MDYLIDIIVFIVIFSVLILIHEVGHFIMAKRAGIRVEEFGFGLPPRIWGKKKGDTIYSINWIPFGGFVRMFGDDSSDPKTLKSKRSFVGKPMRARVKVIVAGVVMNFLLAWLLLVVGFTAGMQPLLGPDEVLTAIDEGVIELVEGVKVSDIEPGSLAAEVGISSEDVIYSINGRIVDDYMIVEALENPVGIYKVIRNGEIYTYEVVEDQLVVGEEAMLGLEFYDFVPFPRVKIFELDKGSKAFEVGLRSGDIILNLNDHEVYSVREFEEFVRGEDTLEYEIYRDGFREKFIVELDQSRKVIMSSVIPDMPADKAGFKAGDVIISINGNKVDDSLELIEFMEEHADETLAYLIERDGERIFYEVKSEDGKIGMFLSELMTYGGEQEMTIYNADILSSIVKINDVQYPFYVSIYKSFGESVRLAKLTGKMFVGVVFDLVSSGEVPETVAGPVGIARLTHEFIQDGLIPVLRFVAILSLSLAVINILPFPALDGGRLLFIVVELIIGRRINQRWEAYIHALGYVLILLLILAVTYSDIVRWIGS